MQFRLTPDHPNHGACSSVNCIVTAKRQSIIASKYIILAKPEQKPTKGDPRYRSGRSRKATGSVANHWQITVTENGRMHKAIRKNFTTACLWRPCNNTRIKIYKQNRFYKDSNNILIPNVQKLVLLISLTNLRKYSHCKSTFPQNGCNQTS